MQEIFTWNEGDLEKIADDPKLYASANRFLEYMVKKDFVVDSLKDYFSQTVDNLHAAWKRTHEGVYLVQLLTDTWASRTEAYGEEFGVTVAKFTGHAVIEYLSHFDDHMPTLDDAIRFLKKENISSAFTLDLPAEGLYGELYKTTTDGQGDFISHDPLEEEHKKAFANEGITITYAPLANFLENRSI